MEPNSNGSRAALYAFEDAAQLNTIEQIAP